MPKIQTSCSIEPELHERLKLVAMVDRRSMAEIVADCIALALPRLSPEMVDRLKSGERLADVLAGNLAPFAPVRLNETPPAYVPTPTKKTTTGAK
jgi:predicted DNA-binding protein